MFSDIPDFYGVLEEVMGFKSYYKRYANFGILKLHSGFATTLLI